MGRITQITNFNKDEGGFWSSLLSSIKSQFTQERITSLLKCEFVKFSLKKILGVAAAGGPQGWLVKFIAEELFEEIAVPLINIGIAEAGYQYEKMDGKTKVSKINEAENDNDEAAYNTAVDDLYS